MPELEDKDNESLQQNFIVNRDVFVVTDIEPETSSELITDMFTIVNHMSPCTYKVPTARLTSPYDIDKKNCSILDIYLDSKGGDTNVLRQITGILALAKNKGVIVRTHVYGCVYSAASILAVHGTPGYRIMGENAFHFIHFGSAYMSAHKTSEIDKIARHMKTIKRQDRDAYLKNTQLTSKKLDELQSDEMGYLDANQCLKYGLCDWILMNNGRYISRSK